MTLSALPVEELKVAYPQRFVYEFLQKQQIGVLSTIAPDGKPEAAVVEFSARENLELIFDTYVSFRKYDNLIANPNVAVVIGWPDVTVQYEGDAFELTDPDELAIYRNAHLEKFPDAIKFEEYAGMKYFKIVPRWVRYTDVSEIPWKRILLEF